MGNEITQRQSKDNPRPLEWIQNYGLTVTVERLTLILRNCCAEQLAMAMSPCGNHMMIALDVKDFDDATTWLD